MSISLFILSGVGVILGFLIRGWFAHVNTNLVKIWDRIDTEARARDERWNSLHITCSAHGERLAKIEGRLNGKTKIFDALNVIKE